MGPEPGCISGISAVGWRNFAILICWKCPGRGPKHTGRKDNQPTNQPSHKQERNMTGHDWTRFIRQLVEDERTQKMGLFNFLFKVKRLKLIEPLTNTGRKIKSGKKDIYIYISPFRSICHLFPALYSLSVRETTFFSLIVGIMLRHHCHFMVYMYIHISLEVGRCVFFFQALATDRGEGEERREEI